MKAIVTISVVPALFVSLALMAPEQPPPAERGVPSLEEQLKRLDRDGDGQLRSEEADAIPSLKSGFDYIDTDRNRAISPDEMKAAMAWWQQRRGDEEERPSSTVSPKPITPPVTKKPDSIRPPTVDVNFPQFRGPRSDGVAHGTNLPVTWSATSNIVWSCVIPGKGWSSPVVWGDRVFVTSAIGPGSVETRVGTFAEQFRGVTTTDEHQYVIHCVDWRTGKLRWSRCAHKGVPPGPIHPKNTYASETPVTDGERVYAYFGNIGLFCYDMDGHELWTRKWGSFKMDWNWGPAASPTLHAELLLVLNDNQEKSFLVALDKRTGREVWRVDREEKSNWSSPFVWQNERRTEIVTVGTGKVRSYDLNGRVLWELRGMSGVTVPTPFAADGLLYIASGCSRSSLRPVYAIRPGASGDISLQDGSTTNSHIVWCQRRAAPYVTSLLVYDDLLYVLLDNGFLTAYDARSGKEIYSRQRFPGGKAAFSASPWAYDGKIFCLAETGTIYVVEAGPEFRVLHINHLDEPALATPAVVCDSLVLRTLTRLYRIANVPGSSLSRPESQIGKKS